MHFEWLDHLSHRDELLLDVELLTAMRIGRGKSFEAATDLPILRDARGVPVIPGSSLKGSLRSESERLLRGLALGEGATPERLQRIACDVLDEKHACLAELSDDSDDPDVAGRTRRRREQIGQRACLVCATFGGPSLASHVRVHDARVEGAPTCVRDGVAIDRDLARVSGARKYDFEIIEAGTRVSIRVVIDNARPWQLGLLFAGLGALDEGGRIGGFGSRGLGSIRIAGLDTLRAKRQSAKALVGKEPPTKGPEQGACLDALFEMIRERAGVA